MRSLSLSLSLSLFSFCSFSQFPLLVYLIRFLSLFLYFYVSAFPIKVVSSYSPSFSLSRTLVCSISLSQFVLYSRSFSFSATDFYSFFGLFFLILAVTLSHSFARFHPFSLARPLPSSCSFSLFLSPVFPTSRSPLLPSLSLVLALPFYLFLPFALSFFMFFSLFTLSLARFLSVRFFFLPPVLTLFLCRPFSSFLTRFL